MRSLYQKRVERLRYGIGWEYLPGYWALNPASSIEKSNPEYAEVIVRNESILMSEPGTKGVEVGRGDTVRVDGEEYLVTRAPAKFDYPIPHCEITVRDSRKE